MSAQTRRPSWLYVFLFIFLIISCGEDKKIQIQPRNTPYHQELGDTGIFIKKPDQGFYEAETFLGLQHQVYVATLVIKTINKPLEKVIEEGYNKERLKRQKIKLKSEKEVDYDGKPGVLLELQQKERAFYFRKHVLMIEMEDSKTILIRGTAPIDKGAIAIRPDAYAGNAGDLGKVQKQIKGMVLSILFQE